ncbi:MAG: peptidylprolyl isomerase [Parvibaculales bacterium]
MTGKSFKHFGTALLMAACISMTDLPAMAQTPNGGVVAKVNGTDITYDDIALVEEELRGFIGQMPEQQRFETVRGYMVDRVLAAQAARKAGLENDPQVKLRQAFMDNKALQDVYVARELMARVDEKKIEAYYRKEISAASREEEVRARHILVDDKETAQDIIAQLAKGADFVALAKEKSKGPSGPSGGDLGYFGKAAMVAPFSEAAFKLEKGGVSEPVKTRFGWHVIKVEDRRVRPTPPLEEVRGQIFDILLGEARRELYGKLRENADISFVDPSPTTEE